MHNDTLGTSFVQPEEKGTFSWDMTNVRKIYQEVADISTRRAPRETEYMHTLCLHVWVVCASIYVTMHVCHWSEGWEAPQAEEAVCLWTLRWKERTMMKPCGDLWNPLHLAIFEGVKLPVTFLNLHYKKRQSTLFTSEKFNSDFPNVPSAGLGNSHCLWQSMHIIVCSLCFIKTVERIA